MHSTGVLELGRLPSRLERKAWVNRQQGSARAVCEDVAEGAVEATRRLEMRGAKCLPRKVCRIIRTCPSNVLSAVD